MKRAQHQPETLSISIYAGVYYRVWSVADAETLLPQHSHQHGHLTALLSGAVRAWRDGELLGDFVAPAVIKIPAHALHAFLTLAPHTTLACIHNADHIEGDEPEIAKRAHLDLED